jgi:hypothetical protein
LIDHSFIHSFIHSSHFRHAAVYAIQHEAPHIHQSQEIYTQQPTVYNTITTNNRFIIHKTPYRQDAGKKTGNNEEVLENNAVKKSNKQDRDIDITNEQIH